VRVRRVSVRASTALTRLRPCSPRCIHFTRCIHRNSILPRVLPGRDGQSFPARSRPRVSMLTCARSDGRSRRR
jgi:hypothetical protein